jgi:DNA-binding NarL/FixJ family response regulator
MTNLSDTSAAFREPAQGPLPAEPCAPSPSGLPEEASSIPAPALQPLPSRAVRVLLIGDSPIFCAGLRSILSGSTIEAVAEAHAGSEAVALAASQPLDVILLDARLPGNEGFHLLATLHQAAPQAAIIVLSAEDDPGGLLQAIAHGAACFLAHSVPPRKLLAAIEGAASGRVLVDRTTLVEAVDLLNQSRNSPRRPAVASPTLTAREAQILALMALGLPNRRIADALGLSMGTIKTHVCNILAKLGASDRVQAAVWATQHGLGPQGSAPAPAPPVATELPPES